MRDQLDAIPSPHHCRVKWICAPEAHQCAFTESAQSISPGVQAYFLHLQ
jgi:hypothetical protein